MKHLICFIILYLTFGCTNNKLASQESFITKIGNPLTHKDTNVLNDIKNEWLKLVAISRSAFNAKHEFDTKEKLDQLHMKTIPYYDFDGDAFSNDPCPERILNCFSKTSDIWYIGTTNDQIAIMLEAKHADGAWRLGINLEGIDYFKSNLAWLSTELEQSDSVDVKLLNVYHTYCFALTRGNQTKYYSFLGFEMSGDDFCQFLLTQKNRIEEGKIMNEKIENDPLYLQKTLDEYNKNKEDKK